MPRMHGSRSRSLRYAYIQQGRIKCQTEQGVAMSRVLCVQFVQAGTDHCRTLREFFDPPKGFVEAAIEGGATRKIGRCLETRECSLRFRPRDEKARRDDLRA